MKRGIFFTCILSIFLLEITILIFYTFSNPDFSQDTVLVNEIVQSVKNDWEDLNKHKNYTNIDYVILDKSGKMLYRTTSGLSEGINAAAAHRDTILNIEINNTLAGQVIIWNNVERRFPKFENEMLLGAKYADEQGLKVGMKSP